MEKIEITTMEEVRAVLHDLRMDLDADIHTYSHNAFTQKKGVAHAEVVDLIASFHDRILRLEERIKMGQGYHLEGCSYGQSDGKADFIKDCECRELL